VFCLNCNKETKNPKYCCRSCSVSKNNLGVQRNKPVDKICLNCSNKVKRNKSKFCSMECSLNYKAIEKRREVLSNLENGKYISFKQLRALLLDTYKTCQECNIEPIWNNKPLSFQIDHIDGNSDNNDIKNLRVLCPNCHTQTITWCSRNIKNTKRNKYLRRYKAP